MKRYLLLTSVVLVSAAVGGAYAAVDCSTPPSCSELGYDMTASECGSAAKLKCPFGDGYYCVPEDGGGSSTEPDTPAVSTASCGNGMILYDDMQCYNGFPTDRTPVGIVIDAKNSMAAVLTPNQGTVWGIKGTNTGLGDCAIAGNSYADDGKYADIGGEGLGCTFSGFENNWTQSICTTTSCEKLGYCNSSHPWLINRSDASIFNKCGGSVNFSSADTSDFLPSAKEVRMMAVIKDKFNQSIASIREHYSTLNNPNSAEEINTNYYWTSNEADANNALAVNMNTNLGTKIETKDKASYFESRCVFYYGSKLGSLDFLSTCKFNADSFP